MPGDAARTDRRVEELAFLRALGEVMASDLRADKALARAVDLCFVRFELGALCAFRYDDGVFRLVAAHGVGGRVRAALERVGSRELSAMLGGSIFTLALDIGATDRCTILTDEHGPARCSSALFAPLVYARRRLGALLVVGHDGDILDGEARATWQPIVDTIAVALRAADDFERVVALEAEKRQLVDNLPLIVARFDAGGTSLSFINGAVQRVLGIRPSDALNSFALERALVDTIEAEASRAARDRAAAGVPSPWEDRRYRHADGPVLTLRECVYPVLDAARAVQAIEVIAYDITTEIEARKELMRADRLAALGALASGVAHEINNPVAFISLAAGQLGKLARDMKREGEEGGLAERITAVVEDVGDAAARIAHIVGELKLFTRIDDTSVASPVDVNRVLSTALALTATELQKHARVEIALGALPAAPGTFINLGHAFVNLLMNAAQAIDSKLAREGPGAAPQTIRVSTFMRHEAIVIAVEDSGIGIDGRALPRIFDPFFKTTAAGGGAGLGLAIAHDLVRRVGGDIRVESQAMRGTRFEIVLPLGSAADATDVPESTPMPTALASLIGGPATVGRRPGSMPRVLVIDDERALVRALARQLSNLYDVDTAPTARDALAQLAIHSYDVIVCDLRMPDQSGPQIYDEVRARSRHQAARFVFTTGGSYGVADDELHRRADQTGLPLLEKPFDVTTFEAVVARVAAAPWGPT